MFFDRCAFKILLLTGSSIKCARSSSAGLIVGERTIKFPKSEYARLLDEFEGELREKG